jgi:hypothetical protein
VCRLVAVVCVAAALATACTRGSTTVSVPSPRPCKELGLSCAAKRLPNRILQGDDRDGALVAVGWMSLDGILTFDQALRRGWYLFHPDSKTIRVVLGAANAARWHWGRGRHLYYAIEYGGVCVPASVSAGAPTPIPPCFQGNEAAVIEARTGRFVVAGTA